MLTAARGLFASLGVGERTLPDPEAIEVLPPRRGASEALGPDLSPAERRLALAPLRYSRTGLLRWNGQLVTQSTQQTCGAMVLLLVAAAGDPVLAAWLVSGRRIGHKPPPELARLRTDQLTAPTIAQRLAHAERAIHERAREHALGPVDWPRGLGTPPWGAAREIRFRGVEYTHIAIDDHDVAATRRVLASVKEATRRGLPVPLYTGGDLRTSLSAAVPRHVVLALPYPSARPVLRVYDPASGRVGELALENLLARTRAHPLLGGWSHLVWAVLPRSAFLNARTEPR